MPPKLSPTKGQQTSNTSSGGIRSCKVTSVVLDDTHKLFAELGGWNSIGTITFSFLDEADSSVNVKDKNLRDNIAVPVMPNVKNYPLINEIVTIIELPTIPKQGETSNSIWYYLTGINFLNSPHQNSYILTDNTSVLFNNAGVPFRNVKQGNSKIDLGKFFKDVASVRPLLSFEGDVIYEGRNGNSIRLGGAQTSFNTQWKSKEQANYFIISGRTKTKTENIHVIEDINKDDYIIAGFSNHKVNVDLPCLIFDSYNTNVKNNLSAPESLYEASMAIPQSTEDNQTTDPTTSSAVSQDTQIYVSPQSETQEEFYNEAEGEFESPEYVYVLDEVTVNERAGAYNENPDHVIFNTNVIPVNYLTLNQFSRIVNSSVIAAKYLKALNQTLTLYKINTNKRIAHFLAQCLIESRNFTTLREIGDVEYFSKYEKPGNKLGNTQKGDGYKYRGVGVIQITGRYNMDRLFRDLNLGITNPNAIAKSPLCVISAGWYWNLRSLNRLADADQIGAIRAKVQGTSTDRISDIKREYVKIINILKDATS